MSIRLYNFIFLICFFPLWVLQFNFSNLIKFLIFIVLFFLIYFNSLLLKSIKKKKIYLTVYLSFLFTLESIIHYLYLVILFYIIIHLFHFFLQTIT
jgi:hypothetical protein